MVRHLDEVVRLMGESIGVREMRKHLCWYTKGLPGGGEFRERVNHLVRVEAVKRELTEYFANLPYSTAASLHA
jgi:tRNA-dihydrouridine synthase